VTAAAMTTEATMSGEAMPTESSEAVANVHRDVAVVTVVDIPMVVEISVATEI
jgi:hypothetical protein